MTAADLAERLEVSERTIYRDVEALGSAGVPVYSEPGRNGGIRLLAGYKTDLSGLSLSEAELLPLLGLSDVLAGIGVGQSIRRTEQKVLAALPEDQRRRAEQSRRRVYVDLSRWWEHAEHVPYLPAIVEAVFASRRIRLEYKRGDNEVVRRTLEPFGLVVQGGTWYLVARARERDIRTYRVSRVQSVTQLDTEGNVPDDFDLAGFWAANREEFHQTRQGFRVVARARPIAVRSLRDGHDGPSLVVLADDDPDWKKIEIRFVTRWAAQDRLLGLGPNVEVLEPDELRRAITESLARTAHLYDT
jgi:predicted DNA-binding transcriptional regulator YafY